MVFILLLIIVKNRTELNGLCAFSSSFDAQMNLTMDYKLILDFGNTLKKIAVFRNDELLDLLSVKGDVIQPIEELKQKYPQIKSAILSSVIKVDIHLFQYLKSNFSFLFFDHSTKIPIKNLYKTPETLGKDRLAAAIGAALLFPQKNVLVIDAGSSITYEILTERKEYLGGVISPGIRLRAKALNQFTDQLPLVDYELNTELLGTDTKSCLQSGIVNGAISEVNSMIDKFVEQFGELEVILTGGDAKYFEKSTKYNIFASANLVLEGLNHILDFNEL
jgi:type III pantothenate kinase